MKLRTLLGDKVIVIPDDSDEQKTKGGIIIPTSVKENLKSGIIAKKGTGTPINTMDDLHLKQRVFFKRGSGKPYEEDADGHTAKYLILTYNEILFA